MVAKRHKITNVPLFKKIWDIIFFFGDNNFLSRFLNSGTLIVISSVSLRR
jgi:hypothetical protein